MQKQSSTERYLIKHRTQEWTACLTWSLERAEKWLQEFDARLYMDKTLRREDFAIVDMWAVR